MSGTDPIARAEHEEAERQRELRARGGDAARDVRAYLLEHPEFIVDNVDVLVELIPPEARTGDNVLDMQRFMLERIRGENGRLHHYQRELVGAARANMATQQMVHAAVLAMLEATTFEHLIHTVTSDLASILDVDVVTLCVERGDEPPPRVTTAGVYVVPPGTLDRLMGPGQAARLRDDIEGEPVVFGPAASLVRSDALVRLEFAKLAPQGCLALGSREPRKFHDGQGSELLSFLAASLERLIRAWLDLPT
jgi:uncharacterized protein YigA (DUF484 family)